MQASPGNGLELAPSQIEIGHIVFVVDAHALEHTAGDDGRLEQREQQLEKHTEIRAAVDDPALVQSPGQVLKELQEDEDGDNVRAAQHDHIAVQVVDEVQVVHDLVHRYLSGNAGDQGGKGEQDIDQAMAREPEAVELVGQGGTEENRQNQHHNQHDAGVFEAGKHLGHAPRLFEVVEVEKVGRQIQGRGGLIFLRGLEGGEHTHHHRHQGHNRREDEGEIFENIENEVADTPLAPCFHISPLLPSAHT